MTETKYRILIADDDEMIRTLHAEFVRGFGYDVELAADGIEAIAKVGLGVDLLLTDGHMPNMDGFAVARRIRQTKRSDELPIVMVTSLEARQDGLRAYEVGINDFINKPVDPTELRLRLKWLLELKSAQDQLRTHRRTLEDTVERRTTDLRHALEEVTRAQRMVQEGHLDTIRRLTVAAEYEGPRHRGAHRAHRSLLPGGGADDAPGAGHGRPAVARGADARRGQARHLGQHPPQAGTVERRGATGHEHPREHRRTDPGGVHVSGHPDGGARRSRAS
ncbi:MAG: response regulator [Gemmatimonadetes bacterium]|nr:response regulator [Gemmatimonadota bacterium]